jgi:ubiquinone/menaquinone biosynthesis C-methylase UbiE
MSHSAKDVQEFFERVASDWDAMRLAYYDERVIEKMAEVSGIGEASEVADVGTGTGFVAAGIAPRVERVVGIDNAPAMLEVARENLRALGASNVDLVVGEASLLPLAQGAVDAAFANMVLHHAEDPEAMLREMARVVRPGGTVAIADEVAHPYAWMREEHADVWLGFERGQVERYFGAAGLEGYGYELLGMQ